MRALIIANGELIDTGALKRRIQAEKFDLVAAADGGARNAGRLGVHPQIVIGDMDSLPDTERAALKGAKFISYPPQKDATDLEMALIYTREYGADHMVVIGATGGRLESTVANTLMLAQTKLNDCDIEMWHGLQTARLILPPGRKIAGEPGDAVSLVPLGGDASGVSTEGLQYPLRGETLFSGTTRGISNVIKGLPAKVALAQGQLLVVHTPHREKIETACPTRTVNVAIQVLPFVEDIYAVVDKAIAAIQASGVKYEVGPLETTMEGDDLDHLLEVAKEAHRACLDAGAGKVVSFIKIADSLQGTTIEEKVGKYRKGR